MILSKRPGYIRALSGATILGAVLSFAAAPTTGVAAAGEPATATSTSITVPGAQEGVAVDSATDTAYVATRDTGTGAGSVDVVNLATGAVVTTIAVGEAPDAVAVNAVTDTVYVANRDNTAGDGSTVSVIDGATNTVTTTITVSGSPNAVNQVAVDPDTNMAYAGITQVRDNGRLGAVAVIDGAANTVVTTVPLPCGLPLGIADDPATNTVYATCSAAGNYRIFVISGESDTVTATISPSFSAATAIAVNPATDAFYVADATSGDTVSAFSGATNAIIGTVTLQGEPTSLAVNSATNTEYAVMSLPPVGVDLINGAGTTVTGMLPGESPGQVSVDPDTDTMVFAGPSLTSDESVVSVISLLPPAISSRATTTFTTGLAGKFQVYATGTPTPRITAQGKLPAGVGLSQAGTLSGTPGSGSGGVYRITITAANGVAPAATQGFTLTVDEAPAIVSANHFWFTHGKRGTFVVRTSAYPVASVSEKGALPPGLRFTSNKNGTATISGIPTARARGKTYVITLTAKNGVGKPPTARLTLRVG